MSRRRKLIPEPGLPVMKVIRIICTDRGGHPKVKLLKVNAVPTHGAAEFDHNWTMMERMADGTYAQVRLQRRCRECGRNADLNRSFDPVCSGFIDAHPEADTLDLDISLLT